MQIKFLNIYDFCDTERRQVQYELLEFWQNSISNYQVDFIHKAAIEFNEYSLYEYPDQVKLNKEINYKTSYHIGEIQVWQALGKRYEAFDELYDDLAKTHRLMELVITVED